MERIGIYGGAFNPPHMGHVQAAQYALDALRLQRLLVIPSCISPHKDAPVGTPDDAHRLQMTRLAFSGMDKVTVSDLELTRGGVSYTVDTLQQLRKLHPQAQLVLCMGTDQFLTFTAWKDYQMLLSMAELAVVFRGLPEEQEKVLTQKAKLEALGAKITLPENPVTKISSTDLRRLVSFGCTEAYLPESVAAYIRENKLYGFGGCYRNLSMQQLEQAVVSLLKPSRVAHVLGCRDTCIALAKQWGANEVDAGRAGLLHDITKALDGPLQLTLCRAYGTMLSDFSVQNPKTLHALTGSLVAERIFGENEAVVSAICSHTTGKANMNLLEKIVYVADYMEPNRDFPGVEKLRQLACQDMDLALKTGLEMTISMLIQQNREISKESLEALQWLDERMKKTC